MERYPSAIFVQPDLSLLRWALKSLEATEIFSFGFQKNLMAGRPAVCCQETSGRRPILAYQAVHPWACHGDASLGGAAGLLLAQCQRGGCSPRLSTFRPSDIAGEIAGEIVQRRLDAPAPPPREVARSGSLLHGKGAIIGVRLAAGRFAVTGQSGPLPEDFEKRPAMARRYAGITSEGPGILLPLARR